MTSLPLYTHSTVSTNLVDTLCNTFKIPCRDYSISFVVIYIGVTKVERKFLGPISHFQPYAPESSTNAILFSHRCTSIVIRTFGKELWCSFNYLSAGHQKSLVEYRLLRKMFRNNLGSKQFPIARTQVTSQGILWKSTMPLGGQNSIIWECPCTNNLKLSGGALVALKWLGSKFDMEASRQRQQTQIRFLSTHERACRESGIWLILQM